MARTEYKFQYMPLEGRLPGKVMEQQTEDAINDLGIWLVDVSETADAASTLAQDAYDRAIDAQSTADKAQSAADNAQNTADEAMRAAGNAQSAGDQAQTSADEAMAAAKAAQESADHAQESADAAQGSADTAQESADKAQETADSAQGSADAAQTAADAALASLNGHVDDTDNPHQVTAAQLGLASAYVYRGTVDEYADLPEDAEAGDVYNVVNADEEHGIKAGDNVAWTGENWDNLSGIFDTSGLETEISEVLQVANNAQDKATEAVADIDYQDSTLTVTKGDGSEKQFTIEGGLTEAVTDVVLADNTLTVTGSDGTSKEYSIDCTKAEEALTLAETANSTANTALEKANEADDKYLPLTGGTLTGDLIVGSVTLRASDGHIVLPSGVEVY